MSSDQPEIEAPATGPPTTDEENYILKTALHEIGTAAVPGLMKMLSEPDWRLRAGAAGLLGEIDPFPEAAIPALLRAMEDPHCEVRQTAGYVAECHFNPGQRWMKHGRCSCTLNPTKPKPNQEPFLNALIPRVGDTDPGVRIMAVGLLGRLGGFARPALRLIKERLNDENKAVQYYARQAFVQIDPEGARNAGVTCP